MKFKELKIILLAFLFLLIGVTVSKAGYSASNPEVESGGTVSISISSSTALDAYNVDLQNNGGLSFVSCSKSESGAIVNTHGSSIGYMNMSGSTKNLGTYKFKAPTVTEKKTYTVIFSINQGEATVKSNVTVKPKSASNNNNIKPAESKKGTVSSCKINGVTVKESLTVTNKDSVPVVVKTSTGEGLTIYNSLTKKSYKVKSGEKANVQILEGTNTLTITLDSGAKATRKIYSQKEEVVKPNSIEEGQEQEDDVKVTLKTLKIDGFTLSPEFSPEVYEYTLTIPEDKSDITKLDIQADPSEKDYTVEIKGNEDLEAGENIITIIVKSKDGEKTATYTIKVNKEQTAVQVASNVEEIPQEVEEVKENETAKWIIVIFTALVAIAGIIFAVIEYQYGKTHGTDPKGEIPFANIGFETGKDTKSSILGNIKEDMIQTIDDEKINKKGKHF